MKFPYQKFEMLLECGFFLLAFFSFLPSASFPDYDRSKCHSSELETLHQDLKWSPSLSTLLNFARKEV